MKISLDSGSFISVPLERIVRRLSQAGYDGIEISGLPPHAPLASFSDATSRRWLTSLLSANGLEAAAYAPDWSTTPPAVESHRQEYLEMFRRCVDFCAAIECRAIRVDTVAAAGSIPENEYDDALERVADLWTEAAEIAHRANVRTLWEFQPGLVFHRPSEILRLHRRVGHPDFLLLFDTAHAYLCSVAATHQPGEREVVFGGLPEFLRKLESRIGAVHLMDSDGELAPGETRAHRPFGDGYIDFRTLAPQLLDADKVEWWCVDLGDVPDAWELIEPSLEFVEDLLSAKTAA